MFTKYDPNMKKLGKFVLYYISEPPKSNMAATVTQLVDQKLNVDPVGAHSTGGHCNRCFS